MTPVEWLETAEDSPYNLKWCEIVGWAEVSGVPYVRLVSKGWAEYHRDAGQTHNPMFSLKTDLCLSHPGFSFEDPCCIDADHGIMDHE